MIAENDIYVFPEFPEIILENPYSHSGTKLKTRRQEFHILCRTNTPIDWDKFEKGGPHNKPLITCECDGKETDDIEFQDITDQQRPPASPNERVYRATLSKPRPGEVEVTFFVKPGTIQIESDSRDDIITNLQGSNVLKHMLSFSKMPNTLKHDECLNLHISISSLFSLSRLGVVPEIQLDEDDEEILREKLSRNYDLKVESTCNWVQVDATSHIVH